MTPNDDYTAVEPTRAEIDALAGATLVELAPRGADTAGVHSR